MFLATVSLVGLSIPGFMLLAFFAFLMRRQRVPYETHQMM